MVEELHSLRRCLRKHGVTLSHEGRGMHKLARLVLNESTKLRFGHIYRAQTNVYPLPRNEEDKVADKII